jgi:hypothetical protein
MLTQCLNHSCRQIVILTMAVAIGIAIIHFTTSESQATYDVAASQSGPATAVTDCAAKASKLMKLMEATAPVIK